MRNIVLLFFLIASYACNGQDFHWPVRVEVAIPKPIFLQLKQYVEQKEGYNVVPEQFTHLPVYNVLKPAQKTFTDGIYYYTCSVHDSGRLFINNKGGVTVLRNTSTKDILEDFQAYIKANKLSEHTQVEYLAAISAFLRFTQEQGE
ncbi:hypothetical protein [Hymenobacter daecheongensis]|uniref:hypothetical protein n=1 Tax=Hymenobacter daecheongensis TaxID=496053 RepID=UPI0009340BDE|nr:hypothetical protein [Hymenobacter daecheongensis]